MKRRLLWKLLAVNLPVIGIVIAVLWLAIELLAADYFTDLMERYKISPSDSHKMFLDAVHRYFIQAAVVALALACLLSVILTRKVLRPLSDIGEVTNRLASGDYSARITAAPSDEIGDLANAFNRMADSLEHLEGLRRSMVADFAHELRTPLTNIRGYLEALADGVVTPSKETYDLLQDEIMRLVRLVEDLNQLTSADAARAYLRREDVDLRDYIERVLTLNRYEFDARNIAIDLSLASDIGSIQADPDKLLQILRNLIQNAWQYTPEGGKFRISANRAENRIRVAFENSGESLTQDETLLLFERFHRIEKSRSRETGGAGIDLSIVKQLVEAHGGAVGVEPGDDSICFWIELPA